MKLEKPCILLWKVIMTESLIKIDVNDYDEILKIAPFSLDKEAKTDLLNSRLNALTNHHYKNCDLYRKMLDATSFNPSIDNDYHNIPYLPVSLFKQLELKSISDVDTFKTMTSSGTTGQAVSRIILDRKTANNQQKTLVKIVSDFAGSSRMPMIIIDSSGILKDRLMFSARGAGILGFSIFGSDKIYALDDQMNLDVIGLTNFLTKHAGEKILLFGFTFMVWQHFYQELKKLESKLDLSKGILIHGGGWKKLLSESVSPDVFKKSLNDVCGLVEVHDYYGMVEQTGCIYMECEYGHLHASIFSDIITRRPLDFAPCDIGEPGIIQVVSLLPESYPGHSLLTEDEGIILGEDDCSCGRKGKYFKVFGRIKNAEIRGCSDTYATKF